MYRLHSTTIEMIGLLHWNTITALKFKSGVTEPMFLFWKLPKTPQAASVKTCITQLLLWSTSNGREVMWLFQIGSFDLSFKSHYLANRLYCVLVCVGWTFLSGQQMSVFDQVTEVKWDVSGKMLEMLKTQRMARWCDPGDQQSNKYIRG